MERHTLSIDGPRWAKPERIPQALACHALTGSGNRSGAISTYVVMTPYGYHLQQPNWGGAIGFLEALFGNGNDFIAAWNTTIPAFEAATGTITTGGNADIYLKNEGFNHINIAPNLNPQP